jgi:hypothetical protein
MFFGLGGYLMGMHLKISDAHLRGDDVPDFMKIAEVPADGVAAVLGHNGAGRPRCCARPSDCSSAQAGG